MPHGTYSMFGKSLAIVVKSINYSRETIKCPKEEKVGNKTWDKIYIVKDSKSRSMSQNDNTAYAFYVVSCPKAFLFSYFPIFHDIIVVYSIAHL